MKVSIVIPNWNGHSLLEKNLPKVIVAKENKDNNIGEIIVVDDKSSDDSVSFLMSNYSKDLKVIKHRENRGFSSAVNTGVRSAKFPLICLINTDVIPSKNFLVSVLPHFKDESIFGVSLHEEGFGFAIGKYSKGFVEHRGGGEPKKPVNTFWVSGGSGVYRRSIWMKLKGMDDKIFSPFYWEDIDISYRAQKRGYRVLWEPMAKVVHKHESVINVSNFQKRKLDLVKERNQLLFIWKNITSTNLFRRHTRGLLRRLFRHPGYLRVVIAALFKVRLVRKLRRTERRESKVSDEAIFARFDR